MVRRKRQRGRRPAERGTDATPPRRLTLAEAIAGAEQDQAPADDVPNQRSFGELAKELAARAASKEVGRPEPAIAPAEVPGVQQPWFTVAEAAKLLEVSPSRIFDGIRDGRLRVRFRSGPNGETDRPLVNSEELVRKAEAARRPGQRGGSTVEETASSGGTSADTPTSGGGTACTWPMHS